MTKVLLDSNIILDVLQERRPHLRMSAAVWRAVEHRHVHGYLAAHAVTTVFYLARKKQGSEGAKRVVRDLLKVYSIAPVNEAILHEAVRSAMSDFEDGVTAAAAQAAGCALIVTRDPRGFKGATLPCMSPAEALPLLGL